MLHLTPLIEYAKGIERQRKRRGEKHLLCCFPFLELCSVALSDQEMFPLN